MALRLSLIRICVLIAAAVLAACSTNPTFVASYEPWRDQEEEACLASGTVRENVFLAARSSLGGPSVCGAIHPFLMSASHDGRVIFHPPAVLRCSMVPKVEQWIGETVAPAALRSFGVPVTQLTIAASYSCRPMNNVDGARLSEHGHANAVDVSEFSLADGRTISVSSGWQGSAAERRFLREVHDGACRTFTTVLGPEHDSLHENHFHLDLGRHGRDGTLRICK